MKVKKVTEEWEIWNDEKEAVRSEKEVNNSTSGLRSLGRKQVRGC